MRYLIWVFAFFLCFAPFTNAEAKNKTIPIIMIDAGHGGIDGGTQSPDGTLLEKDLNLQIALKLAHLLRKEGFHVALTRESDHDVTRYAPNNTGWGRHKRDLYGRVEAARQKGATLLISLHGNHGTTTNRGAVLYYKPYSFESFALATQLQNQLNQLTNTAYLPRIGKTYYITRKPEIPSVIVEYGYLSNPAEVSRLTDDGYQDKLVKSIQTGIWQFITFYHVP